MSWCMIWAVRSTVYSLHTCDVLHIIGILGDVEA